MFTRKKNTRQAQTNSSNHLSLPRMNELNEFTLFPAGTATWLPSDPLPRIPELDNITTHNHVVPNEPKNKFTPNLKAQKRISKVTKKVETAVVQTTITTESIFTKTVANNNGLIFINFIQREQPSPANANAHKAFVQSWTNLSNPKLK